jgi:hypothetical protein
MCLSASYRCICRSPLLHPVWSPPSHSVRPMGISQSQIQHRQCAVTSAGCRRDIHFFNTVYVAYLRTVRMGSVLSTVTSLVAKVLYYVLHPVWLQLWPPLQLVYLICKRGVLREENLKVPVTLPPSTSVIREGGTPADVRTFEGSGNNLQKPTMGMTGCPFARNCLPPLPEADVSKGPDPAVVSQKLLARPNGVTKTRPLANLLAGATEIYVFQRIVMGQWRSLKCSHFSSDTPPPPPLHSLRNLASRWSWQLPYCEAKTFIIPSMPACCVQISSHCVWHVLKALWDSTSWLTPAVSECATSPMHAACAYAAMCDEPSDACMSALQVAGCSS